jgi:hypothetical protein
LRIAKKIDELHVIAAYKPHKLPILAAVNAPRQSGGIGLPSLPSHNHFPVATWCKRETKKTVIRRVILILQAASVNQFMNGDHLHQVQGSVLVNSRVKRIEPNPSITPNPSRL